MEIGVLRSPGFDRFEALAWINDLARRGHSLRAVPQRGKLPALAGLLVLASPGYNYSLLWRQAAARGAVVIWVGELPEESDRWSGWEARPAAIRGRWKHCWRLKFTPSLLPQTTYGPKR